MSNGSSHLSNKLHAGLLQAADLKSFHGVLHWSEEEVRKINIHRLTSTPVPTAARWNHAQRTSTLSENVIPRTAWYVSSHCFGLVNGMGL